MPEDDWKKPKKKKPRKLRTEDWAVLEYDSSQREPMHVINAFFGPINPRDLDRFESTFSYELKPRTKTIYKAETLVGLPIPLAIKALEKLNPQGFARFKKRLPEYAAMTQDNERLNRHPNLQPDTLSDPPVYLGYTNQEKLEYIIIQDLIWDLYAGTSERKALEIALEALKKEKQPQYFLFHVRGRESSVAPPGREGASLAQYRILEDVLESAKMECDQNGLTGKKAEEIAIEIAADWLRISAYYLTYNGKRFGKLWAKDPQDFEGRIMALEAIRWARLGKQAREEFRKIRFLTWPEDQVPKKMEDTDRFINFSEDNPLKETVETYRRLKIYFEEIHHHLEKVKQLQEAVSSDQSQSEIQTEKEALERRVEFKKKIIHVLLKKLGHEIDGIDIERDSSFVQEKLDELEKAYQKNESIAAQAAFLWFACEAYYQENPDLNIFDWINPPFFSDVAWAYKALHKGMSPESTFGYLKAKRICEEKDITPGILGQAAQLNAEHLHNLEVIRQHNEKLGFALTLEQLLELKMVQPGAYWKAIDAGYRPDQIARYPWIAKSIPERNHEEELRTGREEKFPLFPADKSRKSQEIWLGQHAFVQPDDWNIKRLGRIILTRLEAGVDSSLHDASFWFKAFGAPETYRGEQLYDYTLEKDFTRTLFRNPPEEILRYSDLDQKKKRRLIKKWVRYGELFTAVSRKYYFRILASWFEDDLLLDDPRFEPDEDMMWTYESNASVQEWAKHETEDVLGDIKPRSDLAIPDYIGRLRELAKHRIAYQNEAQKWVLNHATTPSQLLTQAWTNREAALADGVADNPRAIKVWADLNSMRISFYRMKEKGNVPENITEQDLQDYHPWFSEIVRHYSGEIAIQTLSVLKEKFNPDQDIPFMRIDLGNGWVGEVLKKNDPRGTTIGADTGCCMTLNGISASCISAGYEKPQYGFFVLTRNGEIVAQSFLYTNNKSGQETIVADSIESNRGRDTSEVLERYQQFFRRYFGIQARRSDKPRYRKLHIGTQYTNVPIDHLNMVGKVKMEHEKIYTDAAVQRLGLEISEEDFEKMTNINARLISPNEIAAISGELEVIEESAFEGRGYSIEFLQALMKDPKNIAVVLKDGAKVAGYSVAEGGPDQELYVMSTAILPEYQHRGLVGDLLYQMDLEARKRGFHFYVRDAQIDYAKNLERNYSILGKSEPKDSPWGKQVRLRMEIPEQRPPRTLKIGAVEHQPEQKFSIERISHEEQFQIIEELEREIYPEALQVGFDWLLEEFDDIPKEDLVTYIVKEGNVPIGYVVGGFTESDYDDRFVLEVADMAILPKYQKQGIAKRLLKRLFAQAVERGGVPIEFQARHSTSYPVVLHMRERIETDFDYSITVDESLGRYWEEFGSEEEAQFVRLEKIHPNKISSII